MSNDAGDDIAKSDGRLPREQPVTPAMRGLMLIIAAVALIGCGGGQRNPVVDANGAGPAYRNCDAVRAAGAAPIRPGDPGFQQKFDRDGDGVGCE